MHDEYLPNATRYVPTRQYYVDTAPRTEDAVTESVNFLLDLLIPLFFITGLILAVAAFTALPGAGVPAFLLMLAGSFSLMFRMKIV